MLRATDKITALYCRLSVENIKEDKKGGKEDVSNSIQNQRWMLTDFVKNHPDLCNTQMDEVCDDGWSGKNFERPGVTALLEQVKRGQVPCIVVKDFSRFGRDYLTVGNYITRVFPFMGVRFISVNDSFDSARQGDIDSLDTSFKTLIYDLYSRELSQKVRAAKKQRAEQGLFLSPFAPYGYRKDQDNRNHLVIDGPVAEIVRRIFQMTLDGVLPGKIAASLKREGVVTPMVYKHNAGVGRLWPSVYEENFWTDSTVTIILKDERYIGNVIYGRRTRTNIGHWHSKPVGRDGWVVREDMHEGIVSKEDFARAQGIVSGRLTFTGSHITKSPALLKGKVFCGVCGHAMRRQKGNAQKYHCYTPAVTNEYDCPRGHIPEGDILDAVLEAIRQYARLAVQLDRLDGTRRAKSRREKKDKGKQLIALQNEKSRLDSRLQELYEQFVTGDISKETYLAQKSSIVEREQEIADETGRLERLVMESTAEQSEAIAKYIGYAEVDEMTQEMLSGLLKRVYVYPGNVLEIQLNYTDELGRLQSQYDIGT